MHFNPCKFLLAAVGLIVTAAGAHGMTLSEVMFNPQDSETANEFIELHNNRIFAENLDGWRITDGADTDRVISLEQGLWAAPGQFVLILDPDYLDDGSDTYSGLVPQSALVVTIDDRSFGRSGLSNSTAQTISLLDERGSVASVYHYSLGNADGFSDEKLLPQHGDTLQSWADAITQNGTPGARNSVTPPDLDLAISSFHYDPRPIQLGDSFRVAIQVKNLGLNIASDSLFLFNLKPGMDSLWRISAWKTPVLGYGDSAEFQCALRLSDASTQTYFVQLSDSDDVPENDRRLLTVSAGGLPGSIVINEIMYAPESQMCEWVELYNASDLTWTIGDWAFGDGTVLADTSRQLTLPPLALAPQSYGILAADSSIFFQNVPLSVPVVVWNSTPISLNNSGDSLVLFDQDHFLIDRVDYRPSWNGGATGNSLERISAAASSNDPANWAGSLDSTGGTPGRINSRVIPEMQTGNQLLILEPNPFSPDGDGRDDLLTIRYRIDNADSRLDLKVYDVRGREVRRLADNEPAGFAGEKFWDGRDGTGRFLPTGLYIIYLEALGKNGTRVQTTHRPVALARRS
jgi:hypothetical protein